NDNQLLTLNDWTPVSVFNPIDGTPLTIYNLNPAKKGQLAVLDTNGPNRKKSYDSYGVQFTARLPRGAILFGGMGFERLLENTCDEPDNPNLLRYCDDANLDANLPPGESAKGYKIPFQPQGKLSASVPLPWAIQLSGAFQSNNGYAFRSLTTDRTSGGT